MVGDGRRRTTDEGNLRTADEGNLRTADEGNLRRADEGNRRRMADPTVDDAPGFGRDRLREAACFMARGARPDDAFRVPDRFGWLDVPLEGSELWPLRLALWLARLWLARPWPVARLWPVRLWLARFRFVRLWLARPFVLLAERDVLARRGDRVAVAASPDPPRDAERFCAPRDPSR